MTILTVEQNTTRLVDNGTTETFDTVIVEGDLTVEGDLQVTGAGGRTFPQRAETTYPIQFPATQ